jgi:hypothetical protein
MANTFVELSVNSAQRSAAISSFKVGDCHVAESAPRSDNEGRFLVGADFWRRSNLAPRKQGIASGSPRYATPREGAPAAGPSSTSASALSMTLETDFKKALDCMASVFVYCRQFIYNRSTMTMTLILLVIFYCFALWLGFYLLQRDWRKGYLRMAGLGLVSYAAAMGFRALALVAPENSGHLPENFHQFFIYQPALLWAGGLLHLLPEDSPARRLIPFYYYGQILAVELLVVFTLIGAFPDWALGMVVGLPIFAYLLILMREQSAYPDRSRLWLVLVGTIFFGLSMGLFISFDMIPNFWIVLATGFDLILLGMGIAQHDAYQEGHRLRRSMWHSLQSTFFVCLLIGGQIALATLALGMTMTLSALLLGLLGTGIFLVVINPFQRSNQAAEAVEISARNLDPGIDFSILPDGDFVNYTRRALSYLDDLPKLASSPLTQLPLIEARLASRNAHIDTLARADELKRILTESIDRLKPTSGEAFGTTDAWRYYNAIYFPYVAGLKPWRRQQFKDGLSDDEIQALEWFQREVPERTLHNWQKKAAQLIAQNLQEKQTQA